jgi:phospholipase C
MEPTSRRQFLKRGSAVAAAAGVAAAVPATAAKALTAHNAHTLNDAEPRLPDDESVDVPVVAHVRDVRKGLVTLYTGEREVTVKDRRLAAALYRATH